MTKFLGNRILVAREASKTQTDSGIYLLERSVKPKNIGTIEIVGTTVDESLKGKKIIFDPNCGTNIIHEKKRYIMMFKSDIWGTIKN